MRTNPANSLRVTFTFIASLLLPIAAAVAGPCDAYFAFDGNLRDAGGNSYHGQMIGKEGALATPRFVDGNRGQALELDGVSAMRAFVDLHFDTCPQVTVTAWIQVMDTERKGSQHVFSTGSGDGPGFTVSSTSLILTGTANGIYGRNAIRPNAGWMFVAGVYDYAKGTYTLYSRNRGSDKELGDKVRAPEDAIWVGAFNDKLAGAAAGILIDDLRIFSRALGEEEIEKMQVVEIERNTVTSGPSIAPQIESHVDAPSSQSLSIPVELRRDLPLGVGQRPQLIGGSTAPGGQINGQACSSDSQCPVSNDFTGACYSHGGSTSTCYQRCDTASDCNSGDTCATVTLQSGLLDGLCVPDKSVDNLTVSDDTIYRPCDTPGDCSGSGSECFDIALGVEDFEGSMCTTSCTEDSECGASNGFTGACYSIPGSTAICYPRCDRSTDCNAGNRCLSVTLPGSGLDGVCAPDNSLATN